MVKITNKLAVFAKNLKDYHGQIMHDISSQVLADSNRYVRVLSGDMRASSRAWSELQNGKLVWNTPYAAKVYYTGTPNTDENPNASLMWCERARVEHKDEWKLILNNAIKQHCMEQS